MADSQRQTLRGDIKAVMLGSLCFDVVGVIGLVIYSVNVGSLGVFGAGVLIACAAKTVGLLGGFVFAIPRAPNGNNRTGGNDSDGGGHESANTDYHVNTNLEQISDWLTKILVGVGLTQLLDLPTHLRCLATFLGPAMGQGEEGGEAGEVFAITLAVLFVVLGFLSGYMMTRLYTIRAFRRAETRDDAQSST